jgi:pimeloyl-ACP methyl ester carboxylesterase
MTFFLGATASKRWRLSAAAMGFGVLLALGVLSAQAGGPELKKISLPGGTTLAYKTWGSGPIPVVYVHGYSLSMATWDRIINRVPARYTNFAYDLRGFGDSARGGVNDYPHHVKDLVEFLDAMKIDRAVLIGHSMGGNFLQDFVIAHPDRVRAVVLSDASARVIAPPDPVANRVEERLKLYGSPDDNRKVFQVGMPRYFHPSNVKPGELESWIEIGVKADTTALKEMLQANYALKPVPPEQYSVVTAPVLIINGAHDGISSPAHVIAMSDAMPHAKVVLIPKAGHTPMWEQPAAWSEAVFEFLNRAVPL